jgi:hypothetical protein
MSVCELPEDDPVDEMLEKYANVIDDMIEVLERAGFVDPAPENVEDIFLTNEMLTSIVAEQKETAFKTQDVLWMDMYGLQKGKVGIYAN